MSHVHIHVWSLTSGVNALSVHVVATDANAFGDLLLQHSVSSSSKGSHRRCSQTVQ